MAPSSQRSARRTASATAERSAALTERSLLLPSAGSATTLWRAMLVARSQFTGPPSNESICPSCWNAAPRSPGFMPPNIAAKGLSAPAPPGAPGRPKIAPKGLPAPKPNGCGPLPAPDWSWSFFCCASSGLALPSSGSSGGTPNPKGRSLTGSSIRSAVIRVWRKSLRPGRRRSGGLGGGSRAAGPRRVHRRAFASGRMDVRDTRPYAHKLTVEDGR